MTLTLSDSPRVRSRHAAATGFQAPAAVGTPGRTWTNVDGPRPGRTGKTRPTNPPTDIVEEWGMQSFPASDPPMNW